MLGQHQIPQEISSYEFHLVGNMTLKQFAKMAAGVIIAAIIYTSHLPGFFRLLLVFITIASAAAMAFMPINGYPLERWLLIFFQKIYSPTIFLWQKSSGQLNIEVFSHQARRAHFFKKITLPDKKQQMQEYLQSLPLGTTNIKATTSIPPATAKIETTIKKKKAVPAITSPQKTIKKGNQPKGSSADWQQLIQAWQKRKQGQNVDKTQYLNQAMPATPTQANIISGLVTDENDQGIEGAIVEIQDAEGNPVRAMRTNGLGQFQTATPLANGEYLVVTEKEPYQFGIMKVEVKGEIIHPLKIKAKPIKTPAHE